MRIIGIINYTSLYKKIQIFIVEKMSGIDPPRLRGATTPPEEGTN